jgi:hypothetical protein
VSEQAQPEAAPAARRSRGRSIAVSIVLVLASLFLLLSAFAVWVDRVALNTNVFVDTSSELIEDPAIRDAVGTRAVDELFDSVDVEAELEEQLPDDYKRLSGPATAGLREASYRVVDRALQQPALQRLWAAALEESHRTLVQVLEGNGDRVSTEGGVVTLDLKPIILEAAERIGLRERIESELPENVGRIEILRSDELDTAQDAFQLLNTLAWVLPVFTLVAFGLAVWLFPDRRRAVRWIGISVVVVGLLGLVAVNLVGNYVVSSLTSETQTREAAGHAWDILTALLRHSFRWVVVVGILLVTASWLAGPGRRAVAVREVLAPVVRERLWAYGGLAVAAAIVLVTSAAADFIRFLVLVLVISLGSVWIEVMRTKTLREFPNASASAIFADLRARASHWWSTRAAEARRAPPAPVAPVASLADLHGRGELTDEEFAAAKARVLAGD